MTAVMQGVRILEVAEHTYVPAASALLADWGAEVGQGERGPDADRGSYDSLAFWCRAGAALGGKPPDQARVPVPPAPGFGDSIGAMTIAGGIMGALFHRERTGEATTVDVSLLGTGMWAMGQGISLSLLLGRPFGPPPANAPGGNPLTRNYVTADGRVLAFTCLQ